MFEITSYLMAAAAAIAFLALLWFIPKFRRVLAYGKQMAECGRLGPAPSDADFRRMIAFSRFWVRGFVGRIDVRGHEKLATMPAPFLLAFNHGSLLDVAIAPVILNRKARWPAAQGVMQAFGGLAGALFSRWGVFSVDLDNGHKALEASVNALSSGDGADIEVIFPEAWTHMDGVVRTMKTGAVRIAAGTSARIGRPVPIVPGYMRYKRYPGSWITKLPIPVQWAIPLVFAFYYKRGVTVVIGDPISSADLPADAKEATEILRQKIIALDPGKTGSS